MHRLLFLLPVLALAACQQPAAQTDAPAPADEPLPAITEAAQTIGGAAGNAAVVVSGATCRPTLNGRDVTACHLTLTARAEDRLVSVSTAAAGKVEIHDMSSEGGVMRMAALPDGVLLPMGETVRLEPRGKHLMLLELKVRLRAGDTVPLTLAFQSAPSLQVSALVVAPAA